MRWIGVVLLGAAVLEAAPRDASLARPRIPIAPPGGSSAADRDLVVDRIHSLLAGRGVRYRAIAFVPLHARSPSEARRSGARLPRWTSEDLRVSSPVAGTLRLRHGSDRPLLVTPGRTWTAGKIGFCLLESALIESGSPAFVRAAAGMSAVRPGPGWLDAAATGNVLADPSRATAVGAFQRGDLETGKLYLACERATRALGQSGDRTVVGCVALVGGEPVAAYAFGDGPLFAEARFDLIAVAVAAMRRRLASGTPEVILRERAARANARGVSVAALRALCATPRTSREVPGGGAQWSAGSRPHGVVARALVDDQGRLVFFGAWRVPPLVIAAERPKPPPVTRSDPEEDRRRKKSGRFNPARNAKGPAPQLPLPPPGR